mgnify:CR=1 FL=1
MTFPERCAVVKGHFLVDCFSFSQQQLHYSKEEQQLAVEAARFLTVA